MAKLLRLRKNKTNEFVLFFSRFSVTLALPKLLALGKAKEKHVFLLLFSRFSVTLQPILGTRAPSPATNAGEDARVPRQNS